MSNSGKNETPHAFEKLKILYSFKCKNCMLQNSEKKDCLYPDFCK